MVLVLFCPFNYQEYQTIFSDSLEGSNFVLGLFVTKWNDEDQCGIINKETFSP